MRPKLSFKRFAGQNSRMAWLRRPNLTYEGGPFPREYEFAQTRHTSHLQFTDDQTELNIFMDALGPTDAPLADISRCDSDSSRGAPDFRVTLLDSSIVYAECTRAGDRDVIRFENKFPLMEVRLAEWLMQTPEAATRLAVRYVAFLPRNMPKSKDENEFVAEMRRFIMTENLEQYETPLGSAVPEAYRSLRDCKTLVVAPESEHSHVTVQIPAMATGGPGEAEALAVHAIEAKRRKGYDGYRPIWLAIGVGNIQWTANDVFAALETRLTDIAPFEEVFLCNSNVTLRIACHRR